MKKKPKPKDKRVETVFREPFIIRDMDGAREWLAEMIAKRALQIMREKKEHDNEKPKP